MACGTLALVTEMIESNVSRTPIAAGLFIIHHPDSGLLKSRATATVICLRSAGSFCWASETGSVHVLYAISSSCAATFILETPQSWTLGKHPIEPPVTSGLLYDGEQQTI
jgi:hypothetical protein